jgi:1,4-alpha-glucan branching enzyme
MSLVLDRPQEAEPAFTPQHRFGPYFEGDRARFRLWAPSQSQVELVLDGGPAAAMTRTEDGFWEATVNAIPGSTATHQAGACCADR